MGGNQNQYSVGLDKTPANFAPLTPAVPRDRHLRRY